MFIDKTGGITSSRIISPLKLAAMDVRANNMLRKVKRTSRKIGIFEV